MLSMEECDLTRFDSDSRTDLNSKLRLPGHVIGEDAPSVAQELSQALPFIIGFSGSFSCLSCISGFSSSFKRTSFFSAALQIFLLSKEICNIFFRSQKEKAYHTKKRFSRGKRVGDRKAARPTQRFPPDRKGKGRNETRKLLLNK